MKDASEFGGSDRGLRTGIIQRSTAELAAARVLSPNGNPVVGHDELTPDEVRGVMFRAPLVEADTAVDPVTGRPADSQRAGE